MKKVLHLVLEDEDILELMRILMDDDDPLLPTRRLSGMDDGQNGHKYPNAHK